ncbi:MAG: hypothetical protein LLG93_08910, partial [Deltaproteobacteria bacterium]|nr:hypothetical protein [Deltaproteobacteria bacterium]
MRHPYLDAIIYPQVPDRTYNHGRAPVPAVRSFLTRTLGGTVVTKFLDGISDVVVEEAWLADGASTYTDFYWSLHRYWTTPLPPGMWVAWQPRDLTHRSYWVEILEVVLG